MDKGNGMSTDKHYHATTDWRVWNGNQSNVTLTMESLAERELRKERELLHEMIRDLTAKVANAQIASTMWAEKCKALELEFAQHKDGVKALKAELDSRKTPQQIVDMLTAESDLTIRELAHVGAALGVTLRATAAPAKKSKRKKKAAQ